MKQHKTFVLIDFCARYSFTHHTPLIKVYCDTIIASGSDLLVLLPRYAERTAFINTKGDKHYILTSSLFGPSFSQSPLWYLINRLVFKLNKDSQKDSRFKEMIRKAMLFKAIKFIKNFEFNNKKICFVFPTADPLSIELTKQLSKIAKFKNSSFNFRIVGAESRGQLASKRELKDLVHLAQFYKLNIRLGYETPGFKDYLIKFGFHINQLFWSPWPKLDYSERNFTNSTEFKIGFLGNAKKRKGFDSIPQILDTLKQNKILFSAKIQLACFQWDTYLSTLEILKKNFAKSIEFVNCELGLSDLQNLIKSLDVLILPYDPDSYSINASGLLYHAADYGIPVLATRKVGFESEVHDYGIGYIFDDFQDIPQLLQETKKSNLDLNFVKYNLDRSMATNLFLFEK